MEAVAGDARSRVVALPEARTSAQSRHEDGAVLLANVDCVRANGGLDVLPVHRPSRRRRIWTKTSERICSSLMSAGAEIWPSDSPSA